LVFAAVGTLLFESVERFSQGASGGIRTPGLVLGTAVLGLLVNVLVLRVLDRDHDHTDHVHHQAARLHVMADLAGSLVAIASTAMVIWGGWAWVDPIATIGISVLVATAGVRLLRDAMKLLKV
jgi:cobalt-zinc-cadmium efflux system protein